MAKSSNAQSKKHKSKSSTPIISETTEKEAMRIAKATQSPGQTKAQTKLIEKGIQKGIAEYKKRQKSKARELDKQLKKAKNKKEGGKPAKTDLVDPSTQSPKSNMLPWGLLFFSWILFGVYYWVVH